MADRQYRMSRAARTARGAIGAATATLFAAASHALAGGDVSALSVLVTVLIALPLCVALAGRAGSFWRIAVAIGASQFLYHWAFAGIGSAQYLASGSDTDVFAGAHAAHLAALERFVPTVVASGAADTTMWIMHGVAAVLSALVVWRGEETALSLVRAIWRVFPRPVASAELRAPRSIYPTGLALTLRPQLFIWSGRRLRGPPAAA